MKTKMMKILGLKNSKQQMGAQIHLRTHLHNLYYYHKVGSKNSHELN